MVRTDIRFIMQSIRAGSFDWEQDWKRNWNAQPKTQYFVGRVKPGSGIPYNLKWVPQTSILTLWTLDEELNVPFGPRMSERLTNLLKTLAS